MKLEKILNARKVILNHTNEKLPFSLAYKFMKFIKSSDGEEAFYTERLNAIVQEFAERDSDGKIKSDNGNVIVKKDCIDECNKAISSLRETDVEVSQWKFTFDDLSAMNFSVSEIAALDDFITE